MSAYLLHTERLSLRPCQSEDLDSLHELWTDANVRHFLFDDRQISREEAQSFIETSAANFANYGYGIWLFFENQSDLIAGFAGLLHFSQEAPSLIFGTCPLLWGRGYAKEAARAVLCYAFDVLGLEWAIADVDEPNEASIRVLEALGMSRTRRAIVNGRPLLYYEIHTGQAHL
ncbi:GNAT family N-acetyltransferase [Chlorogloeopsis fritschii PCC 9212]|uniref:GNAT family N-acetyltransferase n=1 Tax=Chlorogloeopsis fritschii TaxID=1124 RepID=UPI00037C6DC3|nr:GNAT family N-acetyltransferase [Chlorogloeopsis fritschii]